MIAFLAEYIPILFAPFHHLFEIQHEAALWMAVQQGSATHDPPYSNTAQAQSRKSLKTSEIK